MAAVTVAWLRLSRAASSTQRVLTSTMSRLLRNSPPPYVPQWATRSTSMKPGWASSHWAKVRTGMACLSSVPGLVVDRPCGRLPARTRLSRRSAVAGLSVSSSSRVSASRLQFVVPLQGFHVLRQHRHQTLAADAVGGPPDLLQGRPHPAVILAGRPAPSPAASGPDG